MKQADGLPPQHGWLPNPIRSSGGYLRRFTVVYEDCPLVAPFLLYYRKAFSKTDVVSCWVCSFNSSTFHWSEELAPTFGPDDVDAAQRAANGLIRDMITQEKEQIESMLYELVGTIDD